MYLLDVCSFFYGQVYLLDVSGTNPRIFGDVPSGIDGSVAGVNTPVFHPDGKSLYMASRDDGWLAKVHSLISHKVFHTLFCRSQLLHKSVNFSFAITYMNNKLTDFEGIVLL